MNARQVKVNDRRFVYIVLSGNLRKLGATAGNPVDYYRYDCTQTRSLIKMVIEERLRIMAEGGRQQEDTTVLSQ